MMKMMMMMMMIQNANNISFEKELVVVLPRSTKQTHFFAKTLLLLFRHKTAFGVVGVCEDVFSRVDNNNGKKRYD